MPLIIPKDLPAYEELQQENVFVMHQERAMSQHIRPLRILILNLMPTKIVDRNATGPPAGKQPFAGAGHLFADGDPQHDPHRARAHEGVLQDV